MEAVIFMIAGYLYPGYFSEGDVVFVEKFARVIRFLGVAQTGIADIFLSVDVYESRMTFGHHSGKQLVDSLACANNLVVHFLNMCVERVSLHFSEGESHDSVAGCRKHCALESVGIEIVEYVHHLRTLDVG